MYHKLFSFLEIITQGEFIKTIYLRNTHVLTPKKYSRFDLTFFISCQRGSGIIIVEGEVPKHLFEIKYY